MKILVLSRYCRSGASSRLRTYQYLPYLSAEGIEVTAAPLLGSTYLEDLYGGRNPQWPLIFGAYFRRFCHLLKSKRYDLVWVEKELFPLLPDWGEALLNRLKVPYIVDYDDAVFHNYELHDRNIVRLLLGKKIDRVMRRADVVVVGNDYLADRALKAGARRVEYLPTVIDVMKYPVVSDAQNRIFTIGWIGTPYTARYLDLVRPALKEICKANQTRVIFVGSGTYQPGDISLSVRQWSEHTEVSNICSFDVGIMPLPDKPFERGKCGYKLIQYMACGKPVVASPVGVNRQIVEKGINGLLATTTEEWVRALKSLRDSKHLRVTMGKNGRKKVEKNYCLQVTLPRLLSILRTVGVNKMNGDKGDE